MSGAGLAARNQAAHIAGAAPEPDAQQCATVAEALRHGRRIVVDSAPPILANLPLTCLWQLQRTGPYRAAVATSNPCCATLGMPTPMCKDKLYGPKFAFRMVRLSCENSTYGGMPFMLRRQLATRLARTFGSSRLRGKEKTRKKNLQQ
jgi:hypothetical protein